MPFDLPENTRRWASVGPYYAMFPVSFAFEVVNEYTKKGDAILDPFAGRASSVFAAYVSGRAGAGIELSPVGWLYGKVKLCPAPKKSVLNRIIEIQHNSQYVLDQELDGHGEFFNLCFSRHVLRFLICARRELQWEDNPIDATLMAIILIDLHGKRGSAISNQMRQSKAMSPAYSVRWWQEKGMTPPDWDAVDFLTNKVNYRYRYDAPQYNADTIFWGDSRQVLPKLPPVASRKYKMLFTSPPYFSVTNYFYDQWLRLWMLRGHTHPSYSYGDVKRKKYDSEQEYKALLYQVFSESKKLLKRNSVVYVRTDARAITLNATKEALTRVFPTKRIEERETTSEKPSQTGLFGEGPKKAKEVDLILT